MLRPTAKVLRDSALVPSGNVVKKPPSRFSHQLKTSQPYYFELKSAGNRGSLWQNLDIQRIAAATGLDLMPIVVEQASAGAPTDGLIRDWPAPDLGADRNRGYMLQWYSFAALAVVLWLALNWRIRDVDSP